MIDRLEIRQGDITQMEVDAIVNAANPWLERGGGVSGAIHAAAGPKLLEACRRFGGCETGEAVITPGFQLPARHVIHTVGPVWRGGTEGEPELLARCYQNSLRLAEEHGVRTIAIPAISTGVYGYPMAEAARIAVSNVAQFLQEDDQLETVILVAFQPAALRAYRDAVAAWEAGKRA